MARWLNRLHLRGKLAFILIVGFVLPMTLLTVLMVDRLLTDNREARIQEMQRSMEHRRDQLDALFTQAVTLSLDVVADSSLNRSLDATYSSPYQFLLAYQEYIRDRLDVSPVYSAVSRMMVYTDNPTLLPGKYICVQSPVDYSFGESEDAVSLRSISGQDLFLRVSTGSTVDFPGPDISIIRRMNTISYNRTYSRILRLSVNLSVLRAELENPDLFDSFLLMDDAGHVLLSSSSAAADSALLTRSGEQTMELPLSACPSLRLVSVYPLSSITREVSRILLPYLLLSLLLTGLGLFFAALVARNISGRLQTIGNHTKGIAEGKFGILDETKMGQDEVGELARDIDQMSRQLDDYIQKEYLNEIQHAQLQREKATAELHALQSQVNPHFMFNALEAIRLKARARGETETARMITYMSRMFRRLLDWHDDLIPLREELGFVQEFLAIQKYRYDHAFAFEVKADEELLDNYIPKMLIQPLVENACVHGVWTDEGAQDAGLTITREGDSMKVVVADRGEGMTPERLQEVHRLLQNGDNSMHSVGLNNVLIRCRLYYGDAARLDVESRRNGGTVFTLIVPVRWKKEDFHVSGSDCG
ncbi:MAG: histidine kinase [Clostridia bacterium]|nr:histidine kinase [Clostridia bacterium]